MTELIAEDVALRAIIVVRYTEEGRSGCSFRVKCARCTMFATTARA